MANSSSGVFDMDRIRLLVEFMKEHDLSEIDLQEKEKKIRLCRGAKMIAAAVPSVAAAPAVSAPVAPAITAAAEGANIKTILSPMVGTYYSKPNPTAEPFVKVGDHIEANTTVCIIEAMKTFNEIPAEIRGKVVAVLVENGDNVDTDKPLFKIDTGK